MTERGFFWAADKMLRPLLAAALITLGRPAALASQEPLPATVERLPSVQLPSALERVLRDYERSWQARDTAALAVLFTEDGLMLADWHASVRRRAAAEQVDTGARGLITLRALTYGCEGSLAYVTSAVDQCQGPIGYIVGAYSEQQEQHIEGKFMLVLRRDAQGTWRIAADMIQEHDQRIAEKDDEILKLRGELDRIRKILMPQRP